jgi:hypothetical protein
LNELRNALKVVGVEITGREARDLEEEFKKLDLNHDNKLSLSEFDKVNFLLTHHFSFYLTVLCSMWNI